MIPGSLLAFSADFRRFGQFSCRIPLLHWHVPLEHSYVPLLRCDVPFFRRHVPLSRRDVPLLRRHVPLLRCDVPLLHRHVPFLRRDVSLQDGNLAALDRLRKFMRQVKHSEIVLMA